MRTILPFDEINAVSRIPVHALNQCKKRLLHHFGEDGRIKSREDCQEIINELLDLYILAFADAVDSVNKQFGTRIQPDSQEVQEVVYFAVDGATWEDRVWTWYSVDGTYGDIERIADTETTRISNTAALNVASRAGAKNKTWQTMLDDRVRDTHMYLQGVTVPIDAEFYTWDGDHAQAPGGFAFAQNNCGCRCELRFN